MLIQQETITFQLPKSHLPKIMAILQSGILDIKGDKAILHFDNAGNLKMIEYTNRYIPVNLTATK